MIMKKTAILIFAIGLLATVFSSFDFFTREKVLDIGSVEITEKRNHRLAWSPLAGIALIAIGGAIYVFGAKEK
jgi:hypothetical protein